MTARPASDPHFPDIGGAITLLFGVIALSFVVGEGAERMAAWIGVDWPAAFVHGTANVLSFGGIAWVGRRLAGRPLGATFPFRTIPLRILPGFMLLLLGFGVLALEGVALLTQVLPIPSTLSSTFRGVTVDSGVVGIFFVVLAGPLVEELVFRGVILGGLLYHYTPRWAIALSAVLFGGVHLNVWQFVPAFGMGLVVGWLFVRTRSLWPCVLFHAAYNAAFGFAAGPMLDMLSLRHLAYAIQGVLPPLPLWLVALGAVLLVAGVGLVHSVPVPKHLRNEPGFY